MSQRSCRERICLRRRQEITFSIAVATDDTDWPTAKAATINTVAPTRTADGRCLVNITPALPEGDVLIRLCKEKVRVWHRRALPPRTTLLL
jgi:hypothetical protein